MEPFDSRHRHGGGGLFSTFIFGSLATIFLALIANLLILIAVCFIIYWFLANAGIVPPIDYIPFIPLI